MALTFRIEYSGPAQCDLRRLYAQAKPAGRQQFIEPASRRENVIIRATKLSPHISGKAAFKARFFRHGPPLARSVRKQANIKCHQA